MNIDYSQNEMFNYFYDIINSISDFIIIICSDEFHEYSDIKNKFQLN